jgi:hypothetical protein
LKSKGVDIDWSVVARFGQVVHVSTKLNVAIDALLDRGLKLALYLKKRKQIVEQSRNERQQQGSYRFRLPRPPFNDDDGRPVELVIDQPVLTEPTTKQSKNGSLLNELATELYWLLWSRRTSLFIVVLLAALIWTNLSRFT